MSDKKITVTGEATALIYNDKSRNNLGNLELDYNHEEKVAELVDEVATDNQRWKKEHSESATVLVKVTIEPLTEDEERAYWEAKDKGNPIPDFS